MTKLVVDTHTHSISSGHAYSTVKELAEKAKEKGIEMFALTDHGPSMLGASSLFHFGNIKILPNFIHGVRVLKGAEANIIDFDGTIDIPKRYLKNLEFVYASMHDVCIEPSNIEDNTNGMINALKNPYVDAIGHPGNPVFEIDVEKVVQAAFDLGKFIEINNQSFISRKGSAAVCKEFIIKCKEIGTKIVTGSDSHYCDYIGDFDNVIDLINEVDMPSELIMSTSVEKFNEYLEIRKARIQKIIK